MPRRFGSLICKQDENSEVAIIVTEIDCDPESRGGNRKPHHRGPGIKKSTYRLSAPWTHQFDNGTGDDLCGKGVTCSFQRLHRLVF